MEHRQHRINSYRLFFFVCVVFLLCDIRVKLMPKNVLVYRKIDQIANAQSATEFNNSQFGILVPHFQFRNQIEINENSTTLRVVRIRCLTPHAPCNCIHLVHSKRFPLIYSQHKH